MNMSPVTVLHLTHNMDVGGAEVMIRHLVEGVDADRFASSVACIDGEAGPIGQAMRCNGITIHDLGRGAGFDTALVSKVRKLIRDKSISILHCHQYTPYCYGVLAAFGTSTKVVFTEHGRFYPDRYTWKRRIVNQVLSRFADRITTISASTRDALVTYEWFPRRRIELIYNGVKTLKPVAGGQGVRQRLGISHDNFVLGTLSRLDSIKNQSLMLNALHSIKERQPNTVLLLVGDGPERDALEQQAEGLGLSDRVFFPGFVSDIADHLDAMDLFLLTSFSEGTSMTLLEAMCLGKPIIATKVGGNVEVINADVTGVLIDSDDVVGLVDAIERLIKDRDWGEQLGKAAQMDFYRRFDLQHMVSHYEKLYASLAAS